MLQVSGPAMGKDFFDREKEVEEIVQSLGKDNVLLVAQRRYGKTSVMGTKPLLRFSGTFASSMCSAVKFNDISISKQKIEYRHRLTQMIRINTVKLK